MFDDIMVAKMALKLKHDKMTPVTRVLF